jgi:hypothetical protein
VERVQVMTEAKNSAVWIWLALGGGAVVLLLLVCGGGAIVGALLWFHAEKPSSPSSASTGNSSASNSSGSSSPRPLEGESTRHDLVVIYRHTPSESTGKVVKRGAPIPAGWVGGTHAVKPEYHEREVQLSSILEDAAEGETAIVAGDER